MRLRKINLCQERDSSLMLISSKYCSSQSRWQESQVATVQYILSVVHQHSLCESLTGLNTCGDLVWACHYVYTWGDEYSRPVNSCCTTAAFPGMSLANTGTSRSMACWSREIKHLHIRVLIHPFSSLLERKKKHLGNRASQLFGSLLP